MRAKDEHRDDRHHSSGQSNRSVALNVVLALTVGIIVFAGFFLYAQRQQSSDTAVTTMPHRQSVIP